VDDPGRSSKLQRRVFLRERAKPFTLIELRAMRGVTTLARHLGGLFSVWCGLCSPHAMVAEEQGCQNPCLVVRSQHRSFFYVPRLSGVARVLSPVPNMRTPRSFVRQRADARQGGYHRLST
jgi:hypothetical protein